MTVQTDNLLHHQRHAAKAEFLTGLYLTLGYQPVKRFELSRNTVYLLFSRERGLRGEHLGLLVSTSVEEVAEVFRIFGEQLLQTQLPRLTRFLILEQNGPGPLPSPLSENYRMVTYDLFLDTLIDLDPHPADMAAAPIVEPVPIPGDLLTTDERTGEQRVIPVPAADRLLDELAATGGNVLVIGPSGTGKTTLLDRLVTGEASESRPRYRFFFDMSRKRPDESLRDFVTRTVAPRIAVQNSRVFDVFRYLVRSGAVLCALDGIDDAVPSMTQDGFLELFTEITQLLSPGSTVLLTSRVSFLEDSPQVRHLLDGGATPSEKLVRHLHPQGVNPFRVPRFSVLRLHDTTPATPLQRCLARELNRDDEPPLAELAWERIVTVTPAASLPRVVAHFGAAFLGNRTTFTIADIVTCLGVEMFEGGHPSYGTFLLRPLFRPVDGEEVAFAHAAYQELLAAEYLRDPAHREAVLDGGAPPRLTEQVREFLRHRSSGTASANDCVLPEGVYLVGPSHHLMLRRVERPVRFDRFPVTVARYNRFLRAVRRGGSQQWDHPDKPPESTHEPSAKHLPAADYFANPAYNTHPAICVTYWSAYAFARFEGKRLPTSLEWEAAARGTDGRLFPWGDAVELEKANAADAWCGRPLITYGAWREEVGHGRLAQAVPLPVDAHSGNVSPYGICDMSGNVWEITGTVLEQTGEVVVRGGSHLTPFHALQASFAGQVTRRDRGAAVGFRCVEEL